MEHRNPARNMFCLRGLIFAIVLLASQTSAQKEECRQRPMDIVFVIDGSRSVRPWNFKTVQDAVKDMVDGFEKIGPKDTQIGLVQYSSLVRQEFRLNQYYTKEDVNEAIDAMDYMEKGTMTGRALQFITEKSFTKPYGARSDNPDVLKVAVVITDGRAQDRTVPIWQKRAKDSGIILFAIGVGRRISDKDLLLIASEPKKKHKFYVKNFDLIGSIPVMLHEQICDVDECEQDLDNCEQICNNTIGSFICGCWDGFILQDDRASCRIYDPCFEADCGYKCEPAPAGGYRCTCPNGYKLDRDEKGCVAISPSNLETLTFSDITHTSMRVSWKLVSPELADMIDHYALTYTKADGTGEALHAMAYEPTAVLEGLEPGTAYRVEVTAVTADGLTSDPVDGQETTLFLGETTLDLFNPSLSTMQARWEPAGGDLLSSYDLVLTKVEEGLNGGVSPGQTKTYTFDGDTTTASLGGLEPGEMYTGVITPMHGRLAGGSGRDTESTGSLKAPKITVTDTTLTTVDVEFGGMGMTADRYVIQLTDVETGEVKSLDVDGSESTARFHDCTPGTVYAATIRGYVTEGGQEYVSPQGFTEGKTKSLSPPVVTIPSTTLSTVDVEWTGIGMPAAQYTVVLEPADPAIPGAERPQYVSTVVGSVTSTKFYGLDPDTQYKATVTGTVIDDDKEMKSPVGAAEGRTKNIPAPVVDITDTGLSTADVMWTISGYTPVSFEVSYCPKGEPEKKQYIQTEDISTKLTGLEPGTEYEVEVVAVDYDDDKKFTSEPGSDTDTTKSIHAPTVTANGRTYTTATVKWGDIGMPADGWKVSYYPAGRPEETIILTFDGSVSKTILQNLDHDTNYEVIVKGIVREDGQIFESPVGTDSFTLGAIDPPDVTIHDPTTNSLDGAWVDKVDADNYLISITEAGQEEQPLKRIDGDNVRKTFSDLKPGTEYTVKVIIEVDDEGNVIQSPPGSATGFTRPAPPVNLDVVDTDSSTITVTFDPPEGGYEYFEAKCVPEGTDPESVTAKRVDKDATSVFCDNLRPGTKYRVYITTCLRDRKSEPAVIDTVLSVDAPENFDLSNPTVHSILATWEPPPWISSLDDIVEYRLVLRSEKLGTVIETTVPGTEVSYLFTSLNPLTKYDGEIIAVVGESTSPPASDSETTLPDEISIEVVDISYNNITVEWTPSSHPDVRDQILTIVPQSEGEASGEIDGTTYLPQVIYVSPDVHRYVIRDVKPATIYDISIQYVYPESKSDYATTSATTLAPPPGPPYGTNITDVQFILHWGFPEYEAEPIGYTVTYVPSYGQMMIIETEVPSGEVLDLQVPGLLPSTEYNVTVVANYKYDIVSEPVKGKVTTKDPKDGCTCRTYLNKQNEMQNTLRQLVSVIQTLTTKIENMERSIPGANVEINDEPYGRRRGDHGFK